LRRGAAKRPPARYFHGFTPIDIDLELPGVAHPG
jgi:hypothetical protein